MTSLDTGPIRQRRRAMWAAGDHPDMEHFNEAPYGSRAVDPEYLLAVVRVPA